MTASVARPSTLSAHDPVPPSLHHMSHSQPTSTRLPHLTLTTASYSLQFVKRSLSLIYTKRLFALEHPSISLAFTQFTLTVLQDLTNVLPGLS